MFQEFFTALGVLAGLFKEHPIPFTIVTIIFVTLIYYKWVWIGRVQTNALKNNYAGWKVDGTVDSAQRLVLRPVKMRGTALATLAFFGGGAVFYALVVLPKGNTEPKDLFAFVIMCAFSLGGIWLFLMSFKKITFDGEAFTQQGPTIRTFACRADELTTVRPISKTIAGGVFMQFGEKGRMRVTANMSGYRQLLEILTHHRPELRALVRAYANTAKDKL